MQMFWKWIFLTIAVIVPSIHSFSRIMYDLRQVNKKIPLPRSQHSVATRPNSHYPELLSAQKLDNDENQQERELGILVLLTVPFAWGSFEPAVRYVYAMDPPLPSLVFSFGYYLVAAVSLITSFIILRDQDATTDGLAIRGGSELGTYLFLGNWMQVLGLKTTSSDRAAFILQLTTIFVPLVQAIIQNDLQAIPKKTWGACFLALLGVFVIGLDGKEGPFVEKVAHVLSGFSFGDLYITMAALFYTFHCIRLEKFAKAVPAVKLAACKATTETILTLLALLTVFGLPEMNRDFNVANDARQEIVDFFQTNSEINSDQRTLPAIAAVLWTGLVTVAYTIYAQSFGQARVSPTDSNIIYTIQPICTAAFAWTLLGETLGIEGFLGGALIGIAVFNVATDDNVGDRKD
jgi:drug/metabolite transporter (DMT)-like permease